MPTVLEKIQALKKTGDDALAKALTQEKRVEELEGLVKAAEEETARLQVRLAYARDEARLSARLRDVHQELGVAKKGVDKGSRKVEELSKRLEKVEGDIERLEEGCVRISKEGKELEEMLGELNLG